MSDESDAAEAIGESIRGLPGVATVDVDYRKDFTHGENFDLTVGLEPAATSGQAQQVARTFVTGARNAEFRDRSYVVLILEHPRGDVTMRPLVGAGVTEDDADATVALFYRLVASPVTERAGIARPAFGEPDLVQTVTVWLRQPVDTAAAESLQRSDPALAGTHWLLRNAPAESFLSASTYTSVGIVPDAVTQQVWTDVTGLAGPDLVTAEDGPDARTGRRVTSFKVSMGPTDEADLLRAATPIAATLTRLARPVDLTVQGGRDVLEVTIGGCFRHTAGHVESPGEAQLARAYERC